MDERMVAAFHSQPRPLFCVRFLLPVGVTLGVSLEPGPDSI